ncbi:MAG: hypothetical protein ACYC69_02610 [Thermodesulfovibrionales bacterium]
MKLQVVIPPSLSEMMKGIPKNNRSVVVGYALMRLFASTERKDVDFLKVVSHESESGPGGGIFTPGPVDFPPIEGGSALNPSPGKGCEPDVSSGVTGIISHSKDIAGGLMDDD